MDRYERQLEEIRNGTFGKRKNLVKNRVKHEVDGVEMWVDEWLGCENYSDLDLGEGQTFAAEDIGDMGEDGEHGDGDGGGE